MGEASAKIQEAIDKFNYEFNYKIDALKNNIMKHMIGNIGKLMINMVAKMGKRMNHMSGKMGKIMNHIIGNMGKLMITM
eukprot:5687356-Heterocapsa_arctica.AAC.1